MKQDLTHLIERCESRAGEDRELDVAIFRWFNPDFPKTREPLPWLYRYTDSLDAVVSLIEQKLPGAGLDLSLVPGNEPPCIVRLWPAEVPDSVEGEAASLARAALAATLRALSALEDSKADLAGATNGDRP